MFGEVIPPTPEAENLKYHDELEYDHNTDADFTKFADKEREKEIQGPVVSSKRLAVLLQHRKSQQIKKVCEDFIKTPWVQPVRMDQTALQHNSMCDLCSQMNGQPTSKSDFLCMCIYCNVVVHASCMKKFKSNITELHKKDSWICFYCIESLDDHRRLYESEKKEAQIILEKTMAQLFISKRWRGFLEKRIYARVRKIIIRLQIWFRIRKRRKVFTHSMQSKLHPVKINISHCVNIRCSDYTEEDSDKTITPVQKIKKSKEKAKVLQKPGHFYFIATVVDHNTQKQKMICESKMVGTIIPKDNQGHSKLIKMFNTNCTMMLGGVTGFQTVVLTLFQKAVKRDIFMGQCTVDMSKNALWRRGGSFILPLEEVHYLVQNPSGVDIKADYTKSPGGSVIFELEVAKGMTTHCGYVNGSSIDDYLRAISFLGSSEAFVYPQKPSAAVCGMIDRTGDSDRRLKVNNMSWTFTFRRLWLAIVEGKMYIYSRMGDYERIVLKMDHFTHSIVVGNSASVYTLHKQGYPDFSFTACNKTDFLRWQCAFLCSMRYSRNPDLIFDVNALLSDIVAAASEAKKKTENTGKARSKSRDGNATARTARSSKGRSGSLPSETQTPGKKKSMSEKGEGNDLMASISMTVVESRDVVDDIEMTAEETAIKEAEHALAVVMGTKRPGKNDKFGDDTATRNKTDHISKDILPEAERRIKRAERRKANKSIFDDAGEELENMKQGDMFDSIMQFKGKNIKEKDNMMSKMKEKILQEYEFDLDDRVMDKLYQDHAEELARRMIVAERLARAETTIVTGSEVPSCAARLTMTGVEEDKDEIWLHKSNDETDKTEDTPFNIAPLYIPTPEDRLQDMLNMPSPLYIMKSPQYKTPMARSLSNLSQQMLSKANPMARNGSTSSVLPSIANTPVHRVEKLTSTDDFIKNVITGCRTSKLLTELPPIDILS